MESTQVQDQPEHSTLPAGAFTTTSFQLHTPKRSARLPPSPLPPLPLLQNEFHLRPASSSLCPNRLPPLLFREPGPPWNSFRDFVVDSLHNQGCGPVDPADVSSVTHQLTTLLSKIGQHYRTYRVVPSWDDLSGLVAIEQALFRAEYCREETPPNGDQGSGDHDIATNRTPVSTVEEPDNDVNGLNSIYDFYSFGDLQNFSHVHDAAPLEDSYVFCDPKDLQDLSNLGPLQCDCEGIPSVHTSPSTAAYNAISARLLTVMGDL